MRVVIVSLLVVLGVLLVCTSASARDSIREAGLGGKTPAWSSGVNASAVAAPLPAGRAASAQCSSRFQCVPGGLYTRAIASPRPGQCTFHATVTWDDGPKSVSHYTFTDRVVLRHQYNKPGIYTLRVTGTVSGPCSAPPFSHTIEVPSVASEEPPADCALLKQASAFDPTWGASSWPSPVADPQAIAAFQRKVATLNPTTAQGKTFKSLMLDATSTLSANASSVDAAAHALSVPLPDSAYSVPPSMLDPISLSAQEDIIRSGQLATLQAAQAKLRNDFNSQLPGLHAAFDRALDACLAAYKQHPEIAKITPHQKNLARASFDSFMKDAQGERMTSSLACLPTQFTGVLTSESTGEMAGEFAKWAGSEAAGIKGECEYVLDAFGWGEVQIARAYYRQVLDPPDPQYKRRDTIRHTRAPRFVASGASRNAAASWSALLANLAAQTATSDALVTSIERARGPRSPATRAGCAAITTAPTATPCAWPSWKRRRSGSATVSWPLFASAGCRSATRPMPRSPRSA